MNLGKLWAFLFPVKPLSEEQKRHNDNIRFYQNKVISLRHTLSTDEEALNALGKQQDIADCRAEINTIASNLALSKMPAFNDASALFSRIEALHDLVRPYSPPGEDGLLVIEYMNTQNIDLLQDPERWLNKASNFLSYHKMSLLEDKLKELGRPPTSADLIGFSTPETVGGQSRRTVREVYGYLRQEAKKAA